MPPFWKGVLCIAVLAMAVSAFGAVADSEPPAKPQVDIHLIRDYCRSKADFHLKVAQAKARGMQFGDLVVRIVQEAATQKVSTVRVAHLLDAVIYVYDSDEPPENLHGTVFRGCLKQAGITTA